MNKRWISLLLVLSLLVGLAACGGGAAAENDDVRTPGAEDADASKAPEDTQSSGSDTEDAADGATSDTATETVDPEEAQPAGPENLPADPNKKAEGGNLPADPNETPQGQPVQKPVESLPAEKPEEKPVQTPDAAPEAPSSASVDLAAFYETALTKGEWPAMGPMEGEALDAFYPGLSAIGARQRVAAMAMMGSVVAELALVEVENAADAEAVEAIFQGRIDYQVGDDTNPGGAWYPASIEGWKNHSRIVTSGNYIMLVAHSAADEVVTAFHALFA